MDINFLSFIIFCFLLTITPGADMALVTKNTLTYSRRGGVVTAFGICTGLLFYGFLTASGLAYLLIQNKHLFLILKNLGACYLIYLGVKTLYSLIITKEQLLTAGDAPAQKDIQNKLFLEGLLTNLLNPKIIVFYLSIIPQFIEINSAGFFDIFSYALIHILMGLVWLYFYATLLQQTQQLLLKPKIKQLLEGFTGFVMVGLGLRMLLEGER